MILQDSLLKTACEATIGTAHPSIKINQKKAEQVAQIVIDQIQVADISFT
jgi:hypothetical protein